MEKPTLGLGIGLPASGKTYILQEFAPLLGFHYLSVDEIREELHISHEDPVVRYDNPTTIHIWDIIREETAKRLQNGQKIIVDATFAKKELRQEFIALGKKFDATIIGIFFDTPPEICWERNLQRDRHTPREVFDERVKQFSLSYPSIEEGFNSLLTFQGENENFIRTTLRRDLLKIA